MSSREKVNPLWVIPMAIFTGVFCISMMWYACLGSTVPESYSTIMLQGFPLIIGTFTAWDVLGRRKYETPTLAVGAIAYLMCFISLPFVNIMWEGFSIGFVLATLSVTLFLVIFSYVVFFRPK